jgi:hypothetical protein
VRDPGHEPPETTGAGADGVAAAGCGGEAGGVTGATLVGAAGADEVGAAVVEELVADEDDAGWTACRRRRRTARPRV